MQWFSLQFYNTWATIENATTSPLPLKPCLYYAALKSQLKDAQYPFLRTITESDPKYKHTSTPCHVSGFTQIWGNCRFSPGTGDPAFKLWAEGDVGQVRQVRFHSSDARKHKMNANVAMCAVDLK